MSLLALALAAEIGAAAPSELKPCPRPAIEKQAGHGLYTHLRRIKTDCGEIRPLSVLFTKEAPLGYSPVPEADAFEATAAPEPAQPGQHSPLEADVVVPMGEEAGQAATFGGIASGGFGGSIVALVGMDARPALIPAVPEPALIYTLAFGLLALVWRRA